MQFESLYGKIERRTTDALLALWKSGDVALLDYLRYLLVEEERLLTDPVFQATFEWENCDKAMRELTDLFPAALIDALDRAKGDFRFPADRKPYAHQLTSWQELMKRKKSIIVTSGTGSGKTECFMIPILSDLYLQAEAGVQEGVGALFLYPLNALMGSQKNRVRAWTSELGEKVRFALYNGKTMETANAKTRRENLPEVCDRDAIRVSPPHILFTNPTMLEYMLVRKKDQSILEKSKGKLRWIVLDEAHTYSGSAAAEIALLIRRVLDAFEVRPEDVRFAATSATIGSSGSEQDSVAQLQRFLAELSGKKTEDITVIGGRRVLPILPSPTRNVSSLKDLEKLSINQRAECEELQQLRRYVISKPVLDMDMLQERFGCRSVREKLRLLDVVSEGDKLALIPLRMHYFIRAVGGIYGCTNPDCSRHKQHRAGTTLPSLTTKMATICPDCGFPMLELVNCRSCGAWLLEGEVCEENDRVRISGREREESFELEETVIDDDDQKDQEEEGLSKKHYTPIWLFSQKNLPSKRKANTFPCGITKKGIKVTEGAYEEVTIHDQRCPACGELLKHPRHLSASASFLSRLLMPTFLEEAPPAKPVLDDMIWEGRKILGFTDNRQGTARAAALTNTEVERSWVRTRVFHDLSGRRLAALAENGGLTEDDKKKLEFCRQAPELMKDEITRLENKARAAQEPHLIPSPRVSWREMEEILQQNGIEKLNNALTNRLGIKGMEAKPADYARALLFDQFARRPRRENSPETLGLARVVYPGILNVEAPHSARNLGITNEEWRDLLKISIDFFLRDNAFVHIDEAVRALVQRYGSREIYPSDYDRQTLPGEPKRRKWPIFNRSTKWPPRLALIICAGLGWHDREQTDRLQEDKINSLLQSMWRTLKARNIIEGSDSDGYSIHLPRVAEFELITKARLCPATHKLIDTSFREYTPWIKGELEPLNISRYKLNEDVLHMPFFPYPKRCTKDGATVSAEKVLQWACAAYSNFFEEGIWSDIFERIILDYPIFLSGEHSAQQSDRRLRKLEKYFEEGKLNFLSCSTTMEMGVDIGGVSMVLMNNVPPKPANYLQRAGRAGRRSEGRSTSITFCSPTPISAEINEDPKQAMTREIEMPRVRLTSEPIIQRHINSCLLGAFIRTAGGMDIREKVEEFFLNEIEGKTLIDSFATWLWEKMCDESILTRVNTIRQRTQLADSSLESLIARTRDTIFRIRDHVLNEIGGIEKQIQRLKQEDGCTEKSPAVKALLYEDSRIRKENVLKFLVEQGFLPGAGIPTGVIEFNIANMEDIKKIKNKPLSEGEDNNYRRKDSPSFHITRALTEYAPGRSVVLDGWVYTSEGISVKTIFNETKIPKVRSCRHCGHQQLYTWDFNLGAPCSVCGKDDSLTALHGIGEGFTELIEPAGFSVDIHAEPTRRTEFAPKTTYVEPLLLNMGPWGGHSSSRIDLRVGDENAQIVYYNIGAGRGFAVCLDCGRTVPMGPDGANPLEDHRRLRGGREENMSVSICRGNDLPHRIRRNVVLAGTLHTDIFEMRVKNDISSFSNNDSLVVSLAVALRTQLTAQLGIDESEIGFGTKRYQTKKGAFQSLFLYDTARGGAGYVSQLPDFFDQLLKGIEKRVSLCTCAKCCSQCLLDRESQWYLDQLDRHVLKEWITNTLQHKFDLPASLAHLQEQAIVEQVPLEHAVITALSKNRGVKEVRLFLTGDISQWDLQRWSLYKELQRLHNLGAEITFIMPLWISTSKPDVDIFIHSSIAYWAKPCIGKGDDPLINGGKLLVQLLYETGDIVSWCAPGEALLPAPNAFFGENLPDNIVRCMIGTPNLNFETVSRPSIDSQNRADCFYRAKRIKMRSFGEFCLKRWYETLPAVKETLQNEGVSIFYSDTYLNSPLSCMLLANLLSSMINKWKMTISSVELNLCSLEGRNRGGANTISVFSNWSNDAGREQYLFSQFKQLGIEHVRIDNKPFNRMEHYRYFEIETDLHCVTIRPDGGIAHGWNISPAREFPFEAAVEEQLKTYHAITRDDLMPKRDVNLLTALVVETIPGKM